MAAMFLLFGSIGSLEIFFLAFHHEPRRVVGLHISFSLLPHFLNLKVVDEEFRYEGVG